MCVSVGYMRCLLVVYLTCDAINGVSVRLRDGKASNRGRVEVYYNNIWGTICDDSWGDSDAKVICKMLGYGNGKAYGSAYFGRGTGTIWLDDVGCSSRSTSISRCSSSGWGTHNCNHGEDAGVWCANSDYGLALRSGYMQNMGTLLVNRNNQWGTVCDDYFDDNEANVACKEMGYSAGGVAYGSKKFGEGTGTIWLDNLKCTGTESKLSLCPHNGWGIENCGHSEDAGVYCYKGSWSSWTSCSLTCTGGTRTRRISCTGVDSNTNCKPREMSDTCNTQPCPRVGVWGSWTAWGSCSVTCNSGTRTRSRRCDNPAPAFGGGPCIGPSEGSESCYSGVRCPVNGRWGSWNAWGSCSVTCSTGTRTRSRGCNNPAPAYGGRSCSGTSETSGSCDSGVKCPVNGRWSSWNAWGSCSVTCSTGTRTRSRVCNNPAPAHGGLSCSGTFVSTESCDSGVKCPVNGQWGSWNAWEACSVTCSTGTRSRSRVCNNPAPAYGGRSCFGTSESSESCDSGVKCPVNGQWGSWNAWAVCSVTCSTGTRTRSRVCNTPAPAYGGLSCSGTSESSESCDSGVRCPVNGQWGSWNAWEACSVTCSTGTRTRSRGCNNPAPAYGGLSCSGTSESSESCDSGVKCPVHGQWGSWNAWEACSVTCSTGTRTRSRGCNNPAPAYGGLSCSGTSKGSESCETGVMCPVNGQWGSWNAWEACSVTCSTGTRTRSRVCNNPTPAYGGLSCSGTSESSESCDFGVKCPVNGQWGSWNAWEACSVTCSTGTRTRSRGCNNPSPAYGGLSCSGTSESSESCETGVKCPVNGQWGSWNAWGSCSVTCSNGTRTRSRVCNNPVPAHGGLSCSGTSESSESCDSGVTCPVNGQWGSWNAWESCSVTCSNGTRTRSRGCNNPAPAYGGLSCSGTSKGSESCETGVKCPVNGRWSSWNAWGSCSVTCSTGTRTRSRWCNNPAPAYGGLSCSGTFVSTESCDSGVKCPVNGQWGSLNAWDACSVTCSTGTRSRSRVCNNPAPAYGGRSCFGTSESSESCDSGIKCPVDGGWSHWETWSVCSVTCANGTRTRSRECNSPIPAYGGASCAGDKEETDICLTKKHCPVDGHWASWELWSACSVTCENGTRTRVRNCSDPAPAYGGQSCTGNEEESEICATHTYCPVDGDWATWESWSLCSVTCENGTRERVRDCSDPVPAYGGQTCQGDDKQEDQCVTGILCPVDGKWTTWEAWSTCSVTCENGTRTRVRSCSDPPPAHGGQDCTGNVQDVDHCVTGIPCPVDGHWASWELWSSCSVSCENGTRTRVRECSDPAPAHGGQKCTGNQEDSESCMTGLFCPVDGQWNSWEAWSFCSVTCENGTRTRVRECNYPPPAYGGQNCNGDKEETDQCVTGVHCPVDGKWAAWESWSSCSVTCENGKRNRVRGCSDPAPSYGGQDCTGNDTEAASCLTGLPCPVDGQWASWEAWTSCSVTCEDGTRTRMRDCSDPEPAHGGQNCIGDEGQTDQCITGVPCPVDGHWASWAVWSPCSVTCESGTRTRVRECSDPEPAYGGLKCTGHKRDETSCTTGIFCPVNGSWGSWTVWSSCSATCANGTRERTRHCNDPAPAHGGITCKGIDKDTDRCETGTSCPVDGMWSSWESWSLCSVTCENGTRKRSRECNDPAPAYGGMDCKGDVKEHIPCVTDKYCPVDGDWGAWMEWTRCSVTCDNGTRVRTRDCNTPSPAYGGRNCNGKDKDEQICDSSIDCPVYGQWGNWTEWSACSVTCECGYHSRSRDCIPSVEEDTKPFCNGSHNETKMCNTNIFCPGACGEGNMMCDDKRTCITSEMSCDGVEHCPGGEDETNCLENQLFYTAPVKFLLSGSHSEHEHHGLIHLLISATMICGLFYL